MKLTLDQASLMANPELLEVFLRLIQEDIRFLRGSYPYFDEWLSTKVLPGLASGERTIVVEERLGRAAGLVILKHTHAERKLCTLRVRPEFEFRGLGVRLFDMAFEVLQTRYPLLSVSEVALPKFSKLFQHFGFVYEAAYRGLYVPRVHELAYNGLLSSATVVVHEAQHNLRSRRTDELLSAS